MKGDIGCKFCAESIQQGKDQCWFCSAKPPVENYVPRPEPEPDPNALKPGEKRCTHCSQIIKSTAKVCRHCNRDQPIATPKASPAPATRSSANAPASDLPGKAAVCIALALGAGFIWYSWIAANNPHHQSVTEVAQEAEQAARKAQEEADLEQSMAYLMSQDFIKDKLKAPASAQFPGLGSDGVIVTKKSDSKYSVVSYVDSQNSFGALLRANYIVVLHKSDADHWVCDDSAILEK